MENRNNMVSIVVPVYNASNFLDQTIQSVINQSYKNWELLLVDDGSKDNSIEIIKKYVDSEKVFLLQHKDGINLGVSKSRELGIENAKGDYIAFLDADDVFYPNKLESQLSIFSKFRNVVLVHSKVEILNDFDHVFTNEFAIDNQDKMYELYNQESWLSYNEICNSTVIVKSTVIKSVKFGMPQLFQYEDWLLWSLIAKKGEFYYQNTKQIKYRIHSNSATASILENGLVSPYSKIEYLITLYLLNDSSINNSVIINKIKEAIIKLFEIYSRNELSIINDFRLEFYNIDNIELEYIEKYNKLLQEYSKLEKKVNKLKAKNSISNRLSNGLKKIFKKT